MRRAATDGERSRSALPRVVALAFALAACLPVSARGQACCAPVVAAETAWPLAGTESRCRQWIGADGRDGVYALWCDTQPWLAVSRDGGQTWQPPLALPPRDRPLFAAADVNAQGEVVVAWIDAGTVHVMASSDQGRSFDPPRAIGRGEKWLQVAVSNDGTAGLAWVITTPGADRVGVAASHDAGRTWFPSRELGGDEQIGQVAVEASGGSVVAAWNDYGSTRLVFVSRTVDGTAWEPPHAVLESGGIAASVRLAESGAGRVALLSSLYDAGESVQVLTLRTSSDGGATWTRPAALARGATGFPQPAVFVASPDGRVHASWSAAATIFHSADHGRPGTWRAIEPPPAGPDAEHPTAVWPEAGCVVTVRDDYRDDDGCDGTCESIYADLTCDGGLTWLAAPMRLDSDAPPRGTHSELGWTAIGPGGRVHALWTDGGNGFDQVTQAHHVALDPPRWPGRLVVTQGPATPCTPGGHRVELEAASLAGCDAPSLRWTLDGDLVPGETGTSLVLPLDLAAGDHGVRCIVSCGEPPGCGAATAAAAIRVDELPTPVDEAEISGILRVTKAPASLHLAWQDASVEPTGYHVYGGTLASLHDTRTYDHGAIACALVRNPGGAADSAHDVAPPSIDSYFVVVPADCRSEGSPGASSLGVRRPQVGSGWPCGRMAP